MSFYRVDTVGENALFPFSLGTHLLRHVIKTETRRIKRLRILGACLSERPPKPGPQRLDCGNAPVPRSVGSEAIGQNRNAVRSLLAVQLREALTISLRYSVECHGRTANFGVTGVCFLWLLAVEPETMKESCYSLQTALAFDFNIASCMR